MANVISADKLKQNSNLSIDQLIQQVKDQQGIDVNALSTKDKINLLMSLGKKAAANNKKLDPADKNLKNATLLSLNDTEDYQTMMHVFQNKYAEVLTRYSATLIHQANNWDRMTPDQQLSILSSWVDAHAYITYSTPKIFQLGNIEDGSTGSTEVKGNGSVVTINNEVPEFNDYAHVIGTVFHECIHVYQNDLIFRQSELYGGLKIQAQIFLANGAPGIYIKKEIDPIYYPLQPIEHSAVTAGYNVQNQISIILSNQG